MIPMSRMRRLCLTMAPILALGLVAGAEETATPAANLDEVLLAMGVDRSGLSIGGKPDWLGQVPPTSVPFRLPHIDAVLDDPPLLVGLGGNLSSVAARALDDELPPVSSPACSRHLSCTLACPRSEGCRRLRR